MKHLIAQILDMADMLDERDMPQEANTLMDAAQGLHEHSPCKHLHVKHMGSDDSDGEPYRNCHGVCEDCGKEMEGYEEIDGGDEFGNPEYGVKEWKEAHPIHQMMSTANKLDEKGLFQTANVLTKIAQEINSTFDPMTPGSANQFDPNLHQLSKDIGQLFTAPKRDTTLDLQTFLHTVASINLKNATTEGVILGHGLAAHIVEEANKLLKEM
jgi:hypothetical protein